MGVVIKTTKGNQIKDASVSIRGNVRQRLECMEVVLLSNIWKTVLPDWPPVECLWCSSLLSISWKGKSQFAWGRVSEEESHRKEVELGTVFILDVGLSFRVGFGAEVWQNIAFAWKELG